ncbi:hypothetical protein ACFOWB_25785 [Chenggangzhangella methanolivorans]|uniref:hypothetical protein n=1 Tax=Chenggangzhangella methanolivorans TaxID=1437009 RepID=UPI003614057D
MSKGSVMPFPPLKSVGRAVLGAALAVALATLAPQARAAVADDPTGPGPYPVGKVEYRLPAKFDPWVVKWDPKVTGSQQIWTEIWARVFYPMGPTVGTTPVVVMLHGEHGTCGKRDSTGKWRIDNRADYSTTGKCPRGYDVTPNHWGYDYIGERLATQGYTVVSINTNRGVNQYKVADPADPDPDLIIRRGRMILRHLHLLGQWNQNKGSPPAFFKRDLIGKLDFSKISLVGHSRGGDAIVSAYYLFNGDVDGWKSSRLPAGASIVSLAAIAPTASLRQRNLPSTLPLGGAAYGVLLPSCDADVFKMEGMRTYDRAVNFFPDQRGNYRAVFQTDGANHNAYNTEWHTTDYYDLAGERPLTHECPGQKKLFPTIGTSEAQKTQALYFVMAIVRSRTKGGSWAELLNPAYDLPEPLARTGRIDRSYFPGTKVNGGLQLVRFDDNPAGACNSKLLPLEGVEGSCRFVPYHSWNSTDLADRYNTWGAQLRWGPPTVKEAPANGYHYAYVVLNNQQPADISKMKTIEFRVGPDCVIKTYYDQDKNRVDACVKRSPQAGEAGSQNIGVLLLDGEGRASNTSYVRLYDYLDDRQAVGLDVPGANLLPVNPSYHALMSSARVPVSEFLRNAEAGFDPKTVRLMLLLLSPAGAHGDNAAGGVFFGDVWATNEPATNMKFDVRPTSADAPQAPRVRPPLPTIDEARARLVAASAPVGEAYAHLAGERDAPADVGARIVDAVRTTAPVNADGTLGAAVEFTLSARSAIIAGPSGLAAVIGGRPVKAVRTDDGPTTERIAVPAAAFDAAPDGGSLAIVAGGSKWRFGPVAKSSVR